MNLDPQLLAVPTRYKHRSAAVDSELSEPLLRAAVEILQTARLKTDRTSYYPRPPGVIFFLIPATELVVVRKCGIKKEAPEPVV